MKIDVKGVIVSNSDAWIYDLFDIENVCPSRVEKGLADAGGEKVDIYINSGGGDVFAGSEIYSAIREYEGEVAIHIVGFCASAASVVAMAGYSEMSPTAQMMVHNVSMWDAGDYHVHDKASEILQTANRSVASAYVQKSGMSMEDALAMMDRETWLTAEEAVELGLVNGITQANQGATTRLVAASFGSMVLPAKILDEYRERKINLQQEIDNLKKMEV